VERQKPGVVVWGLVLVPKPEEKRVIGEGREECKSQLEGVLGFFLLSFFLFFKWKQDYRILSSTEGIFHLLLSD
jgi:hypothetical protein